MLRLDPEGPIPLDIIKAMGDMPVAHAQYMWDNHGHPTAVSGDPHFKENRA